jgi:aryl-alcohol dehydrogenase
MDLVYQNQEVRTIGGLSVPWPILATESGGRHSCRITQSESVPQRFVPELIDLYRQGIFPFDRLIQFYEFDAINQAIHVNHNGTALKPVLLMA